MQLDNGTALMLYLLRREDSTIEPFSSGNFIAADGKVEALSPLDWQVNVLDTWKSPNSGGKYPSKWRISIPKLALSLEGGYPLKPGQRVKSALESEQVFWTFWVKVIPPCVQQWTQISQEIAYQIIVELR